MNWITIQEAIRVAVRDACGLSDTNASGRASCAVVWAKSKEAGGHRPSPHVDLLLRNPVGVGRDETRTEYDEDTDSITETQCGNRYFTVSIRIETDDQRPGSESVADRAGKLRTRLFRQSILAALREATVAISEILPTQDFDYQEDDREVSVSITDVVFSAAENDVDTTSDGAYIKTVTITSKGTGDEPDLLIGEDGEPLPESMQVERVI